MTGARCSGVRRRPDGRLRLLRSRMLVCAFRGHQWAMFYQGGDVDAQLSLCGRCDLVDVDPPDWLVP